jgi:Dyp-type peroxidase family
MTGDSDPPLRNSVEIQGNVLAAFNKSHQMFLLVAFADAGRGRQWLGDMASLVATTKAVEDFNENYSACRRLPGCDPNDLRAVWTNVTLTFRGLSRLAKRETIDQIPRRYSALRDGAARRAPNVGDTGASVPSNWLYGAEHLPGIEAVVTVAADAHQDLDVRLDAVRVLVERHGLTTVFEQEARLLPGAQRGHEHFGFKDGISQPGVLDFHREDPSHPGTRLGHPGEKLIPPGEFVLGYRSQRGLVGPIPDWMRDGSFQVLRRLNQDVPGWWSQMKQGSALKPPLASEALAAKVVGRWPSGTPLAHAPNFDTGAPDDNTFDFRDDPKGERTPRFAHIRKVYPRASTPPGEADSERRRIMRRGIPFGPAYDPSRGRAYGPGADRGLMFQCFCADLERQFEFLQRHWVNNPDFPHAGDGRDDVIGLQGSNTLRRRAAPNARLDFWQFVTTSGAVYAFAPSMTTLRRLANDDL